MPRRSSSGGGSRGGSRYPARSTPKPKPATLSSKPAPATQSGGGLGAAIADGMAWGMGTSFGHRVMDFVMGPRTIKHEVESPAPQAASQSARSVAGSDSCSLSAKAFHDCLHTSGSDISKCQFYMDMLSECRRNSGQAINA